MKAIKAIERMLRQEIPWIDGQPSADEGERSSDDRGRSNGRHRRGPVKPQQRRRRAGAPQHGQRARARTLGAARGKSRSSPSRSSISRGEIISSQRPLSQRITQHRSQRTALPRSRLTALHPSRPTLILTQHHASAPKPPPAKPNAGQQQPSRRAAYAAWASTCRPS